MSSKKLSFNEFLKRAKNLYQDKYVYLFDEHWWQINYKSKLKTKIKFKFKDLIIKQRVKEHLDGRIPSIIHNYKTRKEILKILKTKFPNYNYSLITQEWWQENYKGLTQTRIPIIIDEKIKYRYLKELLNRQKIKIFKLTREDFLKKAKEIHGNEYNYSLITKEWWQKNYEKIKKTKIPIICKKHGVFYQTVFSHLQTKAGCQKCGIEKSTHELNKKKRISFNDFKNRFYQIHDKFYFNFDEQWWEKNYKNTYTKIPLICPDHGEFFVTINMALQGTGCSKCNESKGERKIRKYLEENNINYKYQYPIKIKNRKKSLYFDFYLPEQNIAIEYDGIFHYEDHPKQPLEITKKRDELKNQYCKENNIKLIRIPYWEYDNIEKILEKEVFREV